MKDERSVTERHQAEIEALHRHYAHQMERQRCLSDASHRAALSAAALAQPKPGEVGELNVTALEAARAEWMKVADKKGNWSDALTAAIKVYTADAEALQAGRDELVARLWPNCLGPQNFDEIVIFVEEERRCETEVREALQAKVDRLTAERDETFTEKSGTVWTRPTAWAYYMSCYTRDKWKQDAMDLREEVGSLKARLATVEKEAARLREALEVTQGYAESMRYSGNASYIEEIIDECRRARSSLHAGEPPTPSLNPNLDSKPHP